MAAFGLPKNFTVGVINWQSYLNDDIALMTAKYGIKFLELKTKGKENRRFGEITVQKVIKKCKKKGIHMVLSMSEGDNKTQSRVNAALGYPGVSDLALLSLSSTYISRHMDFRKFWHVPVNPYVENTDDYIAMVAKIPAWPCILKNNLHNGYGYGVFCMKSADELIAKLHEIRADREFEQLLREERDWFLDGVPEDDVKDVPFFFVEEMVRLDEGCLQYCIDGFVDENGEIGVWGMFEELYTADSKSFGYTTPPITLKASQAPIIEKYVKYYIAMAVKQGWKNQAFCAELWFRADDGCCWMTEVNPRAAWCFTRPYRLTYDSHLIKVITLAAAGKGSLIEMNTCPWRLWAEAHVTNGPSLVSVISTTQPGRVGEQIAFEHVSDLRDQGRFIRDLVGPCRIMHPGDVSCIAGYRLLYVYYHGKTLEDLAQQEREDRPGFHVVPQLDFQYPPSWPANTRKRSFLITPLPAIEESDDEGDDEYHSKKRLT